MRVVSPGVSPIAQLPLQHYQHNPNPSPLPQYLPVSTGVPNHGHNPAMAWQQQQPHPSMLPLQQQQAPHTGFTQQQQQQQHVSMQVPLQSMPRPNPDDIENSNRDDVSSVPWGSIRPDPKYNPAKDPLNPVNIDKPFVPPLEITITIVPSRRRKSINRHSSPPPQACVASDRYPSITPTNQESASTEWLQLQVPPLSTGLPGGEVHRIPVLGLANSGSMDVSNTNNPDSRKNKSFETIDDENDETANANDDLLEQFSDLATYTAVDARGNQYYLTNETDDDEEYLELRGDLLELQKLQELQHPSYYDGIAVQTRSGDAEAEVPKNHGNSIAHNAGNTPMEVIAEGASQQRRGMVRREFNRRVWRFKKKKASPSDSEELAPGGELAPDVADHAVAAAHLEMSSIVADAEADGNPGKQTLVSKKSMHFYSPSFVTHNYYNKSKMMTMVSGQENGC